jgi:hypothetical protein
MIITATLALLSGGSTELSKLGYARGNFEIKLVASRFSPYDHIHSETLGGAHGTALYPAGVGNRRFVYVFYSSGFGPKALIFQDVRRGLPRSIWAIDLKPGRSAKPQRGTLAWMLYEDKVKPSGKLSAAQRAALAKRQGFAGYDALGGPGGMLAWFVDKNGSGSGTDSYTANTGWSSGFLPIVPEESAALGLGLRRWTGPGKAFIKRLKDGESPWGG